jgi:hypothetical protein
MCAQLDLEAVCKRPQKEERSPNFHKFWSEEVHLKKEPPKENFDI